MSQKLSARALRAYVVDIVQAALRGRPYKVRGAAVADSQPRLPGGSP